MSLEERDQSALESSRNLVTRRRFVVGLGSLSAGVVASSLLAACGGTTEPPTAAPSGGGTTGGSAAPTTASATRPAATQPAGGSPVAASSGTPKKGGTLIQCLDTDPPIMNPALSTSGSLGPAGGKIYEGLVTLDRELKPVPELAQKWTISEDGLTYTFTLQQGVKFHNGNSFTSEDVKFSMETAGKYQPVGSRSLQYLESVNTSDPNVAVVKFKTPNAPVMGVLDSSSCPMLSAKVFEGKDVTKDPASTAEPVGTGPFVLKEWRRGDSLTLDRNPNYWRKDLPYLDRVILKIIPQTSSRTAALLAGEIDYLQNYQLDPADLGKLEADPKLQNYRPVNPVSFLYVIFNTTREPMKDKRVRQALFTAIDRALINDTAFFGSGAVSKSSIPPGIPWAYNPKVDLSKQYGYDPKKANQMLDDAGYRRGAGGTRFSFKLIYEATRSGHPQVSEIIRANWKDVGVDVTLVPLELSVMLETVFKNWDFDATVQTNGTFGDPSLGISRAYTSSAMTRGNFTNASGYSTPEVDDLFEKGATQPTNDKRAPFFHRIQEILAEDVPTLPLLDQTGVDVASKKFDFSLSLWTQNKTTGGWHAVWNKE